MLLVELVAWLAPLLVEKEPLMALLCQSRRPPARPPGVVELQGVGSLADAQVHQGTFRVPAVVAGRASVPSCNLPSPLRSTARVNSSWAAKK